MPKVFQIKTTGGGGLQSNPTDPSKATPLKDNDASIRFEVLLLKESTQENKKRLCAPSSPPETVPPFGNAARVTTIETEHQ